MFNINLQFTDIKKNVPIPSISGRLLRVKLCLYGAAKCFQDGYQQICTNQGKETKDNPVIVDYINILKLFIQHSLMFHIILNT